MNRPTNITGAQHRHSCPRSSGGASAPQASNLSHSNRRAEEAADFTPGKPMERRGHGNQNKAAPFPIGAETASLLSNPSNPTEAAGAPNRLKIYGPLTTSKPDGAGGPLCRWDREIAHWRAMGKPQLAADLQKARARIAITFEKLEPVFVPTDAQRLLYGLTAGLRSGRDGLRMMEVWHG